MPMEALKPLASSCFPSLRRPPIPISPTNLFANPICHIPSFPSLTIIPRNKANVRTYTAVSPTDESFSPVQELESAASKDEKFDWYAEWYPVAPICDLDKRRPHGKTVIGIDVVIWYDRNDNAWKVFNDSCPHRLAPLSQGRIDQWGRLQCVYHGWCFGGSGDCKFIPQAPRDGPPIHTSKKACVAVYPSCVQNGILWFWPNSDPQYSDILSKKKPHYIPELDDPSYTKTMTCRDIPYGYEVLIANLMDPAHIPYAHYGMMGRPKVAERADTEGGTPIEISIKKLDINGFTAKQAVGEHYFIPPCIYYGYFIPGTKNETTQKKVFLIFYCVPVSPGNSRLIYATPRNFAVWVDRVVPRWIFHIGENLILDSDLYLLHVEERKLMDVGSLNWHKSCYVPTKADAIVVSFRRWLNKYGGTQVDWKNKFNGLLPPTPPREQLLDRFWSHTVNCSSCNAAYNSLNAIEVALKVASISLIGLAAVAKQSAVSSIAARYGMVSIAVVCFVASKWLSHFVCKTFRYHDYDHAFRLRDPFCVQLICKEFFT